MSDTATEAPISRKHPVIDTNRLALGIHPNSVLSVAEMVECARLAETKGFAATWVAEGHRD